MQTAAPPPYRAYAGIMGTFLGGVAATALLAHGLRRPNPERSTLDLAVLGLATFKAARTLARDDLTSFIRQPFVQGSPRKPAAERPVQTGDLRQAVGELVTCSRCIGTWVAAGLAGIDLLAPRFGRMLSWSLAVGGVNDWLQAGFVALTGMADRSRYG